MARGRFVSKEIIRDRQVAELSCDTCRLAYTWLITLADREGRTVGEPDLLCASLFPRRRDITPDMMEGFIQEWIRAGFIIWYQEGEDEDHYIQLVNFEKHQQGLRKNREAESVFPDPADCHIVVGVMPEHSQVKLIKDKDQDQDKDSSEENMDAIKVTKEILNELQVEKITDNTQIVHRVHRTLGDKYNLHDACLIGYNLKKGRIKKSNVSFALMIDEFISAGVTLSDYLQAIDEYHADGRYPGDSPTTYKKWTLNLVKKNNKDDHTVLTGQDYAKSWGVK